MRDIDRLIKTLAKERSQEWFKKPTISEESLDMNYTPIIRSGGEYQDKFKCKIDKDTKFFDASRTPSDISIVIQGCSLRAIVELRYIWMNNGKFGVTWVAKQIQVMQYESEDEIDFVDSHSDSDDEDLTFEQNSSEFLGHKQVFKSLMATGFGKIGDTDSSC